MSTNPFMFGDNFGSNENCIARLEILLPPLILTMNNGHKIHDNLMVPIYEDSCMFFDDFNNLDLSTIKDETLQRRLIKLEPDLKRLFTYVEQ